MPSSRPTTVPAEHVAALRRFNRFHARQISVLDRRIPESEFSLSEVRVLYELAHLEQCSASDLAGALGLDAGYLSRMLRAFEKRGLLTRRASDSDARRTLLSLSPAGARAFASLDRRAEAQMAGLLAGLSTAARTELVGAMRAIEHALGAPQPPPTPYLIRPPHAGDLGWVVHRHGVLYAQEYGWGQRFEALVARIVADFVNDFDARRERCWIAERNGENVGSIFVVAKSKKVAQLRLLLVEPSARGLGIGRRLVSECVRFARQAGYREMILWTHDVLDAARHLYEDAGFRLASEKRHKLFGPRLTGQSWSLNLRSEGPVREG